jgi:hypothetical protein
LKTSRRAGLASDEDEAFAGTRKHESETNAIAERRVETLALGGWPTLRQVNANADVGHGLVVKQDGVDGTSNTLALCRLSCSGDQTRCVRAEFCGCRLPGKGKETIGVL